jgi:hypothetical protein
MPVELTTIHLDTERLGTIKEVTSFLLELENVYNHIYVFEYIVDSLPADIFQRITNIDKTERFWAEAFKETRYKNFRDYYERYFSTLYLYDLDHHRFLPPLKNYYENVDLNYLVLEKEQLILSKVNIQSPGFWEVLGSLGPLTQIREYLKDRHERKKDKQFRTAQEERKGELDIVEKEDELLKNKISILKSLGYTDAEIRPMVAALITRPLARLARFQDNGQLGFSPRAEDDPNQGL